ncbi:MAG TPA: hypothetical protein VFF79_06485 [Conexibacter sp.]|jgi:hypothetical protein|nr:hypothetical protein [Conexibacter sp.]
MKVLAIGRPQPGIDARTAIVPHARDELQALWALYRGRLTLHVGDRTFAALHDDSARA